MMQTCKLWRNHLCIRAGLSCLFALLLCAQSFAAPHLTPLTLTLPLWIAQTSKTRAVSQLSGKAHRTQTTRMPPLHSTLVKAKKSLRKRAKRSWKTIKKKWTEAQKPLRSLSTTPSPVTTLLPLPFVRAPSVTCPHHRPTAKWLTRFSCAPYFVSFKSYIQSHLGRPSRLHAPS